jgi:hypothetical protein
MKILKKYAVLLAGAFLLSAIPALAQDENGVKFDVPFAFQVQDVTMPAGSYTARQPEINIPVLLVQDADGSHSAFVTYTPVDEETPQTETLIRFTKYGDAAFMNRIIIADENLEIQLPQSKAEKRAAENAVAADLALPATSLAAVAGGPAAAQPINGTN